jgi:hypothetical protein
METENKHSGPTATRRNVLVGLVAGVGASAALLGNAKAQEKSAPAQSGPVLFKRTAETERYYKTLK